MIDTPTFTKKITRNKIVPKDGSEPLTVVEFSLTNEIRDKLCVALKPYVAGQAIEDVSLRKIIEDHFPPQIIDEIRTYGRQKESNLVYVVKNLPEISFRQAIENTDWNNKHRADIDSYASCISKGIGMVAGLESEATFLLERMNKGEIAGSNLHKHKEKSASLGGIISDGAPTRFVDMQTFLDQAQADPELGKLSVKVAHYSSAEIPLRDFKSRYPDWKECHELGLQAMNGDAVAFDALIAQHSQEIVIEPGSMVF